ncbi:MAG TPA: hypothetical protein VNJ10_08065 [Sphingomonas sp.]|nr:hypothetical protein [Sphingomonas sp.]
MLRFAFVAALCVTASAEAQTTPATATGNLIEKAVNRPGTSWTFYGANYKVKVAKAPGIPGDQAVRVTMSAKGANPWDAGANSDTVKPVVSGDTMMLAVYLRAPDAAETQTIEIPISVGEADAPYRVVAQATVKVGRDWKLFYASGRAARSYPAGTLRGSVHLAGNKQIVELGPVFLLDMGSGQDPAKLPRN